MYTHSSNSNTPYNQTFWSTPRACCYFQKLWACWVCHVHLWSLLLLEAGECQLSIYLLCPSTPLQPQPQLPKIWHMLPHLKFVFYLTESSGMPLWTGWTIPQQLLFTLARSSIKAGEWKKLPTNNLHYIHPLPLSWLRYLPAVCVAVSSSAAVRKPSWRQTFMPYV